MKTSIVFVRRAISASLLLAVLYLAATPQSGVADLKPTVILVSLDGFRYDYADKFKTPTLLRLAAEGVRAKWMIPSFPTKTFPNHYTIATGLYPEDHGIVENNVYDFGTVFTMSKASEVRDPRWWGGEPIWVTAEKQGQRSASYFFVGSEAPIEGRLPSIYRPNNGKVPNTLRVDKVLSWLDLPSEKRPTMISMHFSVTDDAGHEFGPDSEETRYAALEVDALIARLVDGLKARGIEQRVNLIIVSDHGMAPVYSKNATFLDDHFDFALADRILWTNEIVQIFPKAGNLDAVYDKIKALPHATCWKKGELPERLHYNHGSRVAPIICSSELGWATTSHKRYADWAANLEEPDRPRGAHGYDNRYQEMQATFIAHGPAFKRGFVAEPFENVNVYELMCKILGLKPAKNDGKLENVRPMLR